MPWREASAFAVLTSPTPARATHVAAQAAATTAPVARITGAQTQVAVGTSSSLRVTQVGGQVLYVPVAPVRATYTVIQAVVWAPPTRFGKASAAISFRLARSGHAFVRIHGVGEAERVGNASALLVWAA